MAIEASPNETSVIEVWTYCGSGGDLSSVITIILPEDY